MLEYIEDIADAVFDELSIYIDSASAQFNKLTSRQLRNYASGRPFITITKHMQVDHCEMVVYGCVDRYTICTITVSTHNMRLTIPDLALPGSKKVHIYDYSDPNCFSCLIVDILEYHKLFAQLQEYRDANSRRPCINHL